MDNGAGGGDRLSSALATLFSNAPRDEKLQAQSFLEEFQKAPEAWTTTVALLHRPDSAVEAKLFAAQTLKSKINYDFHQLPTESLPELRNSLIGLMLQSKTGPRPVTTQLVVAIAALALQMRDWDTVLEDMVSACTHDLEGWKCLLHFIAVLPEEINDARRTSIPEEVLAYKEQQLLVRNVDRVIETISKFIQLFGPYHASILQCLNSWITEIPLEKIVNSPLFAFAFEALGNDDLFEASSEFIISMIAETREIDETMPLIQAIAGQLDNLQNNLVNVKDDLEVFRGYARILTEAADSWVVLIARSPSQYYKLVRSVAQLCKLDEDLEVISYSFSFWLELRRMVTLPSYTEAREKFSTTYTDLVDIFIERLHYPSSVSDDPFHGDREAEDKFREFRHDMGDVLKDCCAVAGGERCLMLAYSQVQSCLDRLDAGESVKWQEIEAPLFSMRAMAREVPQSESSILPRLMDALPRFNQHAKIRYAATLVIGRYSEWTAAHPEFMEAQLNYISGGFSLNSPEVTSAAALALRHFCEDCQNLLVNHIEQLYSFYYHLSPSLDTESLFQVTEGMAYVVSAQSNKVIYAALKEFLAPVADRLARATREVSPGDKQALRKVADDLDLISIFASIVRPQVEPTDAHPCVEAMQGVWPLLETMVETFGQQQFICERVCKAYKCIVFTYRERAIVFLPSLATRLANGFNRYHYGCFLWISGACVREYGLSEQNQDELWKFIETQSTSFFKLLSSEGPKAIGDVVEDYYRLMLDTLYVMPFRLCTSEMAETTVRAALASLVIENSETLSIILHFLADIWAYGFATPPTSLHTHVPETVQNAIHALIQRYGAQVATVVFTGMIYTFPRDCVIDASAVLRPLVELQPQACLSWIGQTLDTLSANSVGQEEKSTFLRNLSEAVSTKHWGKIRSQLQDWTTMYRRRMVTPRSRITSLEGLSGKAFNY